MSFEHRLHRSAFGVVFAVAALIGMAVPAAAQDPPKTSASSSRSEASDPAGASKRPLPRPAPVTAEQEQAVLAFVVEHHAELGGLLQELKKKRPNEYQTALRDLVRTTDRLAQFAGRDPVRRELELNQWRLRSRLQVLAARSSMSDHDPREELQALVEQLIDAQEKILAHDRRLAADRLAKLDADLARLAAERDERVAKQLKQVLDGIARSKRVSDRPSPKPAVAVPAARTKD
jgi:hypothetical protein